MSFSRVAFAAAVSLPIMVGLAAASPQLAGEPIEVASTVAASDGEAVEASSADADETSTAQSPADEAVAVEEKKICKTVTPIGTRFGKKYCKTKKEWDDMRKRSQEDVSDAQRRGGEYRTPQ